ncbi:tRNA 4-thiouridine(8) synthase ThiI [Coprothermobacter platensis]|uniref:tRNA 4-thiouridine(8) synthase ThiI n=1 Tax=Coprothermobacter platensis TaxID=108819 RepID=UPI000363C9BA|nr:tRNA 4-thiouridine(8) synthase ThiI [Coprothermobacter platensis]
MTKEKAKNNVRALALLSGGLDSMLAAKLILNQDIEVIGISFESPFFNAERARKAAKQLNIPLITWDITDDLIDVLKSPKHGFGRYFNPCIDCHALMVRKAMELLPSLQGDFIITGEVLYQRPKSQKIGGLMAVAKDSGAHDIILRPLSAQLLPQTKPEIEGLVDRNRLCDIQGRSRERQFALAHTLGINEFPMPAGGCLLTDISVTGRMRKIFQYWKDYIGRPFLQIAKAGRHFWVKDSFIVVSRNEQEGYDLGNLMSVWDYKVELTNVPGPTTIVRAKQRPDDDLLELAALLTARYSKARSNDAVEVMAENYLYKERKVFTVNPSMLEEKIRFMQAEQL